MTLEIIGNIDFYNPSTVSVVTESSQDEVQLELILFFWFTLRMLSLLREEYSKSLLLSLKAAIGLHNSNDILISNNLNLINNDITKKCTKGFKIYIKLGNKGFLTKNKPYGFGLLSMGIDSYGTASIIAFGCYLLNKYKKEKSILNEIFYGVDKVVEFSLINKISVHDEQRIPIEIIQHLNL